MKVEQCLGINVALSKSDETGQFTRDGAIFNKRELIILGDECAIVNVEFEVTCQCIIKLNTRGDVIANFQLGYFGTYRVESIFVSLNVNSPGEDWLNESVLKNLMLAV